MMFKQLIHIFRAPQRNHPYQHPLKLDSIHYTLLYETEKPNSPRHNPHLGINFAVVRQSRFVFNVPAGIAVSHPRNL